MKFIAYTAGAIFLLFAAWYIFKALLGFLMPLRTSGYFYLRQALKKKGILEQVPLSCIEKCAELSVQISKGIVEVIPSKYVRVEMVEHLDQYAHLLNVWINGDDPFSGSELRDFRILFMEHRVPRLNASVAQTAGTQKVDSGAHDFDQYSKEIYSSVYKELDKNGLTANGFPMYLDLEVEAYVFSNAAFETYVPWKDRPRITFLGDGGWTTIQYPVASLGHAAGDGEYVRTTVETRHDGGVFITDFGMGPAAQRHSGGAAEIEAVLTLSPDLARALFVAIGGWKDDTPIRIALRLAIGIATKFSGDLQAISHIQAFCESHGVKPEFYVNFERD